MLIGVKRDGYVIPRKEYKNREKNKRQPKCLDIVEKGLGLINLIQ